MIINIVLCTVLLNELIQEGGGDTTANGIAPVSHHASFFVYVKAADRISHLMIMCHLGISLNKPRGDCP